MRGKCLGLGEPHWVWLLVSVPLSWACCYHFSWLWLCLHCSLTALSPSSRPLAADLLGLGSRRHLPCLSLQPHPWPTAASASISCSAGSSKLIRNPGETSPIPNLSQAKWLHNRKRSCGEMDSLGVKASGLGVLQSPVQQTFMERKGPRHWRKTKRDWARLCPQGP